MNNALVFDFDGEPVRWDYERGESRIHSGVRRYVIQRGPAGGTA